jgi:uncharacterized protein (DUF433 family)
VTIDVAGELANKISISRIYGVAGDLAVGGPEIGVSLCLLGLPPVPDGLALREVRRAPAIRNAPTSLPMPCQHDTLMPDHGRRCRVNWRQHITVDPTVSHGAVCFKGTRIMVSIVLDDLAAGRTSDEVIASYPSLTHEAIRAALAYAAELARERVVALPA